ncbi:hypothetical protein ACHAXH_000036, partial [Discostella pseudostelligera]
MPALTIFRHFSTKPFAGDDLHLVIFVLGAYRVIQAICLVPLFIRTLLLQYSGEDLLVNGFPIWCSQAEDYWNEPQMILTVTDYEDRQIERNTFLEAFVFLSCAFLAVDISWLVMVWAATSVGTPTQPKG